MKRAFWKRGLALLFLFGALAPVPAQSWDRKDKQEKFEQVIEENNVHPKRKAVGAMVKGVPEGEFKFYGMDGKLMMTEPYRNGGLHGKRVAYYPNGQVYSEEDFVNDVLHGESRRYYPDGKPRYVMTFEKGVQHGPYNTFFSNGNKYIECVMNAGKYEGQRKHYLPDGELMAVTQWKDGEETDREILVEPQQADVRKMQEHANFPTHLKDVWKKPK